MRGSTAGDGVITELFGIGLSLRPTASCGRGSGPAGCAVTGGGTKLGRGSPHSHNSASHTASARRSCGRRARAAPGGGALAVLAAQAAVLGEPLDDTGLLGDPDRGPFAVQAQIEQG